MSVAPALPFLKRRARPRRTPADAATAWSAHTARPVDIFTPDRRLTDLLLEHLTPSFAGEVVPGLVWVVRLHPSAPGGTWVLELLAVVERWLAAAKLPWVTVVYDGRNYLIRANSAVLQFATAAKESS